MKMLKPLGGCLRWWTFLLATLISVVMTLSLASPSWAQAGTEPVLPPNFNDNEIVTTLNYPTAMELAPDGRIFVTRKSGTIRVVSNGALVPGNFLTRTVRVERERGMIGIALDPNFAQNNYVYLRYTAGSATTTPPTCRHLLTRVTADGNFEAPNSEVVILDMGPCEGIGSHNGGTIRFGLDGKLYTSIGEQGSTPTNSQTLSNIFGKLLRVNRDGTIPTDNPFYTTASGMNRAIWAYGLRNPFVFAVQPGSGQIFINDVGALTFEEINRGVAGANYGWPVCEGVCSPPNPSFVNPIHSYGHDEGCSITGGAFYNPATPSFPGGYIGNYFFTDWCGGFIRVFNPTTHAVAPFAANLDTLGHQVDLDVGPDGSLYWLNQDLDSGNSTIHVIRYSPLPGVSKNPRPLTVNAGQNATFTIVASGNGPRSYQWQRNGVNIPGATGVSYSLGTTLADNDARFRAIVTNSAGSVTSAYARLTVRQVANRPPVGTISQPIEGTLYAAGNTFHYAGSASDPEDGELPASAFSWVVKLHHAEHVHDYVGPFNDIKSGSFILPIVDETDDNVWYRIYLTVSDSQGLSSTTYRDIRPRKSTITLVTNPPGLQLTLDGQPVTTPYSVLSVEALQRILGAPSPQTLNGVTYLWTGWAHGGAAIHTIRVPQPDTTYTANFVPSTAEVIFADDFETGNLTKWSSYWHIDGGDLAPVAAAAMVGNVGLRALIDDNVTLNLKDESPSGEARYRARFYFDPNTITMADGDNHVILFGYHGPDERRTVMRLEVRFSNAKYHLRISVINDGTTWYAGSWRPITDAPHFVELDWGAATAAGANNGWLHLWIDGVKVSYLNGIDNDTRRIERIRWGALAGIDAGTRGTYYFDEFESRRQSYIGAAAGDPLMLAAIATPDEADATFTIVDEMTDPEEMLLMQEVLEQADLNESLEAPQQQHDQELFMPFVSQ